VSTRNGVWQALDERLKLSDFTYPVPRHANTVAYSLGGISLIGFIVLIVSGILLAQYYDPVPQLANDSVRAITQGVHFAHPPRHPLLGSPGRDGHRAAAHVPHLHYRVV